MKRADLLPAPYTGDPSQVAQSGPDAETAPERRAAQRGIAALERAAYIWRQQLFGPAAGYRNASDEAALGARYLAEAEDLKFERLLGEQRRELQLASKKGVGA